MAETQPVILPPLVNSLLTSGARQLLTSLSIGLAAHGYALSSSQSQTLIEQGTAVVILAASLGWSAFQAYLNHKRLETVALPGVVNAATTSSQKRGVPLDVMVKAQ